jgi:excisionase family DNA binding protein
MDEWLSIGEAARILGVSQDTIRNWEGKGRLRAERTDGDHRRFRSEEVHQLAWKLGRPPSVPTPQKQAPSKPSSPATELGGGASLLSEEIREARGRVEILKAEDEANQILEARSASAELRVAHLAQLNYEEELKWYGRELATKLGLPAEWRAKVAKALWRYVTAARFPVSLPIEEAKDYVRAKVESIVDRYREVVRLAEEERQNAITRADDDRRRREERDARKARVRSLIHQGVQYASLQTLSWDIEEGEDARRDVLEALEDLVESDWSRDQVSELVDEVLAEEDEEGEGQEFEEDDGQEEGE